ncbi:MAG TPA: site-2 protease family protein [Nevskiaceae bacterium]|nr:site-2 protease family protein [Nevskiaceae bacterium]
MFANLPLSEIALVLVCMLIALSLHEAMHAFAAHALGDTTAKEEGRLTINPVAHVDLYMTILLPLVLMLLHLPPFFVAKPVPFNPNRVRYDEFGAALVALAGPFTNLGLAIASALLLRLGGMSLGHDIVHLLAVFTQVNILFFVFNMIPFPPLDGSRLLYAVAPEPVQRLMYQIEAMGFTAILVFVLLLFPFISPIVSNTAEAIYSFLVL